MVGGQPLSEDDIPQESDMIRTICYASDLPRLHYCSRFFPWIHPNAGWDGCNSVFSYITIQTRVDLEITQALLRRFWFDGDRSESTGTLASLLEQALSLQ